MALHARALALFVVICYSAVGAGAWGDAPDDLFRSAAEHYSHERWQAACDDFAKLLETAPKHTRAAQARFYQGEALVQLGRYADAQRQFAELLTGKPDEKLARQALFRAGEAAHLAGDLPAARKSLQAFSKRYPNDELNAYALAYLAQIELDSGQPAAAEPLFAEAVARFKDGPLVDQCRLGLAEAREDLERIDEARRGYEELVEAKSPMSDHALLRLAALDNARGDHAAALARLDRVIKDFPDSPHAARGRLGRGYALYKLGRHADAETALAGLTSDRALAVDAHYWLGLTQLARKSWSEAAETFQRAAGIDAAHRLNPALAYHRAQALIEDGKHQAAAEVLDQALKSWPKSDWADDCYLAKLHVAAAANDHEATVRLADEFLRKFPTSPLRGDVDAAKGHALAAAGKHAEATAALERALADKPATGTSETKTGDASQARSRAQTQSSLAISHARLGRFAEAREIATSLIDAEPTNAAACDVCYQVAELAFAAGDMETAAALFALLARPAGPSDAIRRGLLGQGWCQFKSQDWSRAAATLEQLLTQFPDGPSAGEATLLRGRALEHLEQSDAAIAMYRAAIERNAGDPRAAEAMYRAARLFDKSKRPAEAVELYQRLAKEHADFGELDAVLYRWAWLLLDTDDAAADELFARLRRDFPRSEFVPDATLRLAERAFAGAKHDEAQTLLLDITDAKTPDAVRQHALYLQGRVAAARREWPAVETALARLSDEFPAGEHELPASYLRAEASYCGGEYAQAAERFALLAAKTPEHDQPWSATAELRRAQSLAQLKQWPETLEVARSIATVFPNFTDQYEVDYVIGRALAAQADFNGAREAYARAMESPHAANSETAAMAQWMTGETYFHQENFAAALAEYAKVEPYPFPRWQTAAMLQGGKCQERLGRWDLAVAAYERLLQAFPESELAAEATRRVAAARQRVAGRSPASQ